MDEIDRFKLLSRVFREMPAKFSGLEIAPLTAGRWDMLRERENEFLFGDEPEALAEPAAKDYEERADYLEALRLHREELDRVDAESMRSICEFLWLHTAPLEEVLAADGDPDRWALEVRKFAFERANISEIIDYMVTFREKVQSLAAAFVEPDPDEGDPDEEGEPGK